MKSKESQYKKEQYLRNKLEKKYLKMKKQVDLQIV